MSGSRAKPRAHPGLRSHGGGGGGGSLIGTLRVLFVSPHSSPPPNSFDRLPDPGYCWGQKVCGLQRHKIGSDLSFFLAPVLRKPRAECPRVPGAVKCGQVSSSCRHTVNSRVRARLARGGSLN